MALSLEGEERNETLTISEVLVLLTLRCPSLLLKPDPPVAREISIAVELKSGHVVLGAHATGDRQALCCLHVLDLVETAAGDVGDPPSAREISVTFELKSGHVVLGAHATGNRQAFAGLNVLDLVDAVAGHLAEPPSARRIFVAVELQGSDVVFGAHTTGDRQALAGLGVDEHQLAVGDLRAEGWLRRCS